MKKFLLSTLPVLFIVCAILIIGSNCGMPTTPIQVVCNTTNTPFKTLYNGLRAIPPPFVEGNLIKTTRREYEFQLTGGNTNVCGIGYQAEAGIPGGIYRMSIIDPTVPAPIFDGNLSFSSTSMSYATITPVILQLNKTYIMRRDIVDDGGNVNNTTGQVIYPPNGVGLTLPIVNGFMKITKTSFSGGTLGLTSTNTYLPNIDFSVLQ
jgi:hypothetical protein